MDDDALRRQYDGLIERAGLHIPQARDQTMFTAFTLVQAWTDVVRSRKPAALEPANVFAYETVSRLAEGGKGGAG